MMMPLRILFLPGTGLPDPFYAPLLSILEGYGRVFHWRYRHRESMVEACQRLGSMPEYYEELRKEVCFGPTQGRPSLLGLQDTDSICHWYENLGEKNQVDRLWKRTVVLGHSQGAGHALMLSRQRELAGAVMVAGPADAARGVPAPWTSQPFQTPVCRRLLLVHAQDAGCRATLAHAEACGLRIRESGDSAMKQIGGLALMETAAVPALSAHGCLAGPQTWEMGSPRAASYTTLLDRHLKTWMQQNP